MHDVQQPTCARCSKPTSTLVGGLCPQCLADGEPGGESLRDVPQSACARCGKLTATLVGRLCPRCLVTGELGGESMLEAPHSACPWCGEPATTLVGGLCPRCLVDGEPGGETIAHRATDDTDGPRADLVVTQALPSAAGPAGEILTAIPPLCPDASAPALRAARLELFGEIGRGGMGIVYKGRDPDLGRELAIKVLRDDLRASPEMARRFVEEAQIAGQLQHPGIVPIHELGTFADQRPYFTMKLVKGRTLSRLLAERSASDADRARVLGIFEQVCQTVAYAHAHGVIHRDLKPSNVMVGGFGEVQVMDWGLAKILRRGELGHDTLADRPWSVEAETVIATARSLADSDQSSAGLVLGTPGYMAPEQARGELNAVDERADVFALGSMLCEILSGQPAFTGVRPVEIQRHAADGDLSEAGHRLDACGADAELVELARDCLAPERAQRPRDGGAVASRLTAYLAGVQERLRAAEVTRAAETARAEEATRTAGAERRARRLTAVLAAAGVGLVAVIGGGAVWLQRIDARRIATTGHLVSEALADASRREGEARTRATDDPAGWDAALADANRAHDLLTQGRADPSLRSRVDTLLAALTEQRAEAGRRAERLKVDRTLRADLDAALNGFGHDMAGRDVAYGAAFAAAGLDVDRAEPRAIGDWIAARPSAADLVVYVDVWGHTRRYLKLKPGAHPEAHLVTAARVADPDPWRDRLRAAHADPTALRVLADDEAGLERQSARSLHLLAVALKDDARDWDRGLRVLRLAWRRFPSDFWINLETAVFMTAKIGASPPDQRARWMEERVRFLTAAVAAWPQSVQAQSQLGDSLVELNRFDDALEAYRGLTRLRPDTTAPYTRLGQALRGQKRIDDAVAALREAIRLNEGDADARVELGGILRDQQNLDESVAQLREAIRLKPTSSAAFANYGWSLEWSGKRDDAMAAYREAYRIDCEHNQVSPAAFSLANTLRVAGRVDDAIAVLENVLRINPEEAGAHDFVSHLLTHRERWTDALAHVTWLSGRTPADHVLAAKVAVLQLLSGDDEGYRRQCLTMLERFGGRPGDPLVYAVQSCLLDARPTEPERTSRLIEEELRREEKANPAPGGLGFTRLTMALADFRRGRFAHAAELAKQVRGTSPGRAIEAEIVMAMAAHGLGDAKLARRHLASATRTVGTAVETHDVWDVYWLEWLTCELLLREAKALILDGSAPPESDAPDPTAPVDYASAEILLRAGRVDDTIALLREAVVRKPDEARAHSFLGHLLTTRKQWEAALKELARAAELSPSDDGIGLQVATLHLYLGDIAAYRRDCLAMLERFGRTYGAGSGSTTKSCLISPEPVAFDQAYQIAKQGFQLASVPNPNAEQYGWPQFDWALAEYRKGNYERAADHLKRCRASGGVLRLQSESLLAMTYQRLGLKAEAGRLLYACRAALRKPSEWGGSWHDYLTCELFCREAEALIRDDAAQPAGGKVSATSGTDPARSSTPASPAAQPTPK